MARAQRNELFFEIIILFLRIFLLILYNFCKIDKNNYKMVDFLESKQYNDSAR